MIRVIKFTKSSAMPITSLVASLALTLTALAPAHASADPTLSRIAADEPIHQIGFPPLPDHADLPEKGNAWVNNTSSGNSAVMPIAESNGVGQSTRKQYNHVPPGTFGTASPNRKYHSSNSRSATSATTNGDSVNAQLGPKPSFDPRKDQGISTEAPTAVGIKQSVTQELSMPDDEFSKPKSNNGTASTIKRQLMNPVRQAGSMGTGLMGRIHF